MSLKGEERKLPAEAGKETIVCTLAVRKSGLQKVNAKRTSAIRVVVSHRPPKLWGKIIQAIKKISP